MKPAACMQHQPQTRRQSAFTLIEVMVAMAIFAVLAVISYKTLSSIFDTRERLQVASSALRDQALFFARIENDLNALLPRPVRNGDGATEPALKILAATQTADDATIVFSRTGFAAASGAAATPQRIGYRLKDNTVELLIWDGLDQAPRALPNVYAALKSVRDFRWRVLEKERINDPNATWRLDWDSGNAATTLPVALELSITPVVGPALVRIFPLRSVGNVVGTGSAG